MQFTNLQFDDGYVFVGVVGSLRAVAMRQDFDGRRPV